MDKMMAVRCTKCGSDEAGHDANASWDMARQEWSLASTQDQHWCPNCGEVEHEFCELRGEELAEAMHERRMCGIDSLIHRIAEVTKEGGSIGVLALSEASSMAYAIRAKLAQFAATMAEHDKLVDALALTLPYAETRAADLLDAKLNSEPEYGPGFIEDESCPGADEAASVVEHAGKVLASYGKESRLLERGQRAGGAE